MVQHTKQQLQQDLKNKIKIIKYRDQAEKAELNELFLEILVDVRDSLEEINESLKDIAKKFKP